MLNNLKNRKLSYAGYVTRNTSGHYDYLDNNRRKTNKEEGDQDEHGSMI